jgi:YD repeat-containing protein
MAAEQCGSSSARLVLFARQALLLLGFVFSTYTIADGTVPYVPGSYSAPALAGFNNNQSFFSTTAAGARAAHCAAWVASAASHPTTCAYRCEDYPASVPDQAAWHDVFRWMQIGPGNVYACTGPETWIAHQTVGSGGYCPENSTQISPTLCRCNACFGPYGGCKRVVTTVKYSGNSCRQGGDPSFGNPVAALTASKVQSIQLGDWLGLSFVARYDSRAKLPGIDDRDDLPPTPPSFGALWDLNVQKSLAFQRLANNSTGNVLARRGGGVVKAFRAGNTGGWAGPPGNTDPLWSVVTGWEYHDREAKQAERYDSSGRLQSVSFSAGGKLTYSYTTGSTPEPGLLYRITDHFGRFVQFDYERSGGTAVVRIWRISDTTGTRIEFGYDDRGNLTSIARPGQLPLGLLYEDERLQWALTGTVAEDGVRHSRYEYTSEGRVRSTELAGGVNRFTLDYSSPPVWNVTDAWDATAGVIRREYTILPPVGAVATQPNQQSLAYDFTSVNNAPRVLGVSQPAGSGG